MTAARMIRLCLLFVGIAWVGASPTSAWAHRDATGRQPPEDAIVIPNLTHGQMVVMAEYRSAILDLAESQIPTDPIMRRLEGFISLQYFDCLWGLAPGGVEDERSPFNECSHAYLAAARALLMHLQTMPGNRAAVGALVAKVERDMLDNNASLVLCRYSDEPFNTAERIGPHWREIVFHPPTLIAFSGAGMFVLSCAAFAILRGRELVRAKDLPS